MKFIADINFTTEKHCLDCPLRDDEYDSCNLQEKNDFENWEAQMEKCPLKPARMCEDQDGDKCTVRESLCGITGENTCCLTCGKAKNCEDPCEYVTPEAPNAK